MSKYTDTRKQMVFKTAGGGSSSLAISTTPISGSTPGEILIVGPSNELEESPIKTINGNSLLGSGDLVVGGGGGVHAPMIVPSGGFYFASKTAQNAGNSFLFANNLYLYPFYPMNTVTVSSYVMNVNTGAASALGRILIYSNTNGLPVNKLYESTNIDLSTTGNKTVSISETFTAGTVYWLAFYSNSGSVAMSTYNATSMIPIAGARISTDTSIPAFTLSVTFGSAPTTVTSGALSNLGGGPPAIYLKR